MLRLDRIAKRFAGRAVIQSASFSVAAGEILCITGESGIGKSTLLEIIAGIVRPDTGSVQRNGAVSLCFQDNALLPWLNAAANIDYALPGRLAPPDRQAITARWLARFGLEPAVFPPAMSSGMQRRLNLARAFAVNRPILLLDEPFAFLDTAWQETVTTAIADAVQTGSAVVLTSHDLTPLRGLTLTHIHAATTPLVIG